MFGVINIRTKTREDANLTGISEACKHLNHIKYFLLEFCKFFFQHLLQFAKHALVDDCCTNVCVASHASMTISLCSRLPLLST